MGKARTPRTPAQQAHAQRWSAGIQTALPPSGGSASYEPYRGHELKPYAGRPGALDFLAVPSRMGEDRRAHKPCGGM